VAPEALSSNGRWIAYESMELGYPEIVVRSFPDLSGERIISTVDIVPDTPFYAPLTMAKAEGLSGAGTEKIFSMPPTTMGP